MEKFPGVRGEAEAVMRGNSGAVGLGAKHTCTHNSNLFGHET